MIEGLAIAVVAGTVIGLVTGRMRGMEALLPVTFSVAEGGRRLPAEFTDVAQAYRAPWWRVWAGVCLPASMPYLLAGVDLAIGRALVGAVVAEFIASLNGLGYFILFNVRSFHEDKAMVALVVLVAFALALRGAVAARAAAVPGARPARCPRSLSALPGCRR